MHRFLPSHLSRAFGDIGDMFRVGWGARQITLHVDKETNYVDATLGDYNECKINVHQIIFFGPLFPAQYLEKRSLSISRIVIHLSITIVNLSRDLSNTSSILI